MAELGHDVIGIDVDRNKIDALSAAIASFIEPGLKEVLASASASGRLTFTTDRAAVRGAQAHLVAVDTPQTRGGGAVDFTYVNAAIDGLLPYLAEGDLVVGKSAVRVGTAASPGERPGGRTGGWGGRKGCNGACSGRCCRPGPPIVLLLIGPRPR